MRRWTLGALGGIALLGAGSVAVIALVTNGEDAPASVQRAPAEEQRRPGARGVAPAARASPAAPARQPAPSFTAPAPRAAAPPALPGLPAGVSVPTPSAEEIARIVAPEGPLTAVSRYHGGGGRR